MRIITLIFLIIILPQLAFANSSSGSLSYKSFDNISLGIHSSATNCFFQDKKGMLWIGTNSGLRYYDGYSLKTPAATSPNMGSQVYCAVVVNNLIYLGTERGLAIYDTSNDKYIKFDTNTPSDIRALLYDSGRLWIGSIEGLYMLNIAGRTIKDLSAGLPHQTVYSLLYTDEDELYVGTYNGLVKYNEQENKFTPINIPLDSHRTNTFVNSLIEDKAKGIIWIGTEGALYSYDKHNGDIIDNPVFKGNSIKSLAIDSDKNLIVGTDNGLYIYNSHDCRLFVHDSRISSTISNNVVWSVYVDNKNNLWAGTDYDISLSPNTSRLHTIPIYEITGVGRGNIIYSIFKDNRGYLWLGGANGLIRYDEAKNSSIWYAPDNKDYPITHNRIRDILQDTKNDLWIATDGNINKYDYASSQFIHYNLASADTKSNANWAYNIFVDHNNVMWVGTYLGGIFMLNRNNIATSKGGQISADRNITLPASNVVHHLVRANSGGAWAIFKNAGLYKINYSGDKVVKIPLEVDGKNVFPTYIATDSINRLWCSYNGGMLIIRDDESILNQFSTAKDINGEIYAMKQIKEDMWVLAANGAFAINVNDNNISRVPLPNRSFFSLYYNKESDEVYIGGVDEIVKVPADISKMKKDVGNIVITSVLVNDKPLKVYGRSVRDLEEFTLEYNENHVVIEFSDFNYDKYSRARFQYRLVGSDDEWITLPENINRVSFANLQPGKYKVAVKAMDTPDDDRVKIIKFTVNHPWYYSIWAKIIYAILFVFLVLWIINFFRVKNKLKLERINRESTMNQVKERMELFTNISHEFKTPLSMIIAPVSKLLADVKDVTVKKNLMLIKDSAMKLNNLIHTTLEFNRIDSHDEKLLIFSNAEMIEFCRNIVDVYKSTFPGKTFIFNSAEESLYLNVDVVKMESVINNIMSNACKYSGENATIAMSIRQVNSMLEIKISDDGVGIPPEEIPFIFQRLYQSSRTAGHKDGTGIGLYLAKTYVELHEGNIKVEANETGGTVVTVAIPVPQSFMESIAKRSQNMDNSLSVILIVDDNAAIAEFVRETLAEDYNCIVASDGKAGLAVCGSCVPDLIISDVMMPVMDGLEMCRRIKRNDTLASVPIILLTAKDDHDTEVESVAIGVDNFMAKPFDAVMLKSRVKQLLAKKDALRAKVRIEEISSNVNAIEAESYDERLLSDIIKVIEDNIAAPELNVNFVCEHLGISSKQLYRKIKQHIGITPVEYIKQIRLKKAAMLLGRSTFSVSEVMYMVGFSSSSYFSKCFQQQFGKTPRQYVDDSNK